MISVEQNSWFSRYSFAPSPIPTLAALIALALTLYLAIWQQSRVAEMRALQAEFDARVDLAPLLLHVTSDLDMRSTYRQAQARGVYDAAGQFFVDNKNESMTVGFHVFTPLRLVDTNRYVLVNRGFVARGSTYPTPPAVVVPKGQVEVTGMLVSPIARFFELGKKMMTNSASNATTATMRATSIQGDVWQNITIERYREHTKRDVLPLVLLANPTAFGLKAQTERPNARVEKHIEYMLTWYCLAAVVVILWLVLNFKFYRQPA